MKCNELDMKNVLNNNLLDIIKKIDINQNNR